MAVETETILVTGASGQIGSELVPALRKTFGPDKVVASDVADPAPSLKNSGPFENLDVTSREVLAQVIKNHRVKVIYHLAAILSATGENFPQKAWEVNINGLYNVLEASRELGVKQVFCPSSIAVFGPATPRIKTPQDTILSPTTIYGVTKVAGEHLCDYYVKKYNLDVRGCRFPGIISNETLPGGGTTDYAVAIFYEAIIHRKYTCFLKPETRLPMMYMPDCLKSIIQLMTTDFSRLKHHSNFNVTAMSFSAAELAAEIKKHLPDFSIDYRPDFRQAIADSWPESIDDSAAREEWDWQPDYDLPRMTADMLRVLGEKHQQGKLVYPG
ncbi:MAG: NAD-dependent epimerase/dehydratase family protein [Candidatus Saccharicenans sp.]|jgi:nucleoside-diphosphate-sugar epimerase|nr:NAD-dependent epimerase/dehydratase family protein [Candidatus Saccharicenans sp.]MDH7493639.1 NAD-dependent epimerase/dehydratase family protein [Candidatus Saccharicenans sp.]